MKALKLKFAQLASYIARHKALAEMIAQDAKGGEL